MVKWNTKTWYQKSLQGSNFYRKNTKKLTTRARKVSFVLSLRWSFYACHYNWCICSLSEKKKQKEKCKWRVKGELWLWTTDRASSLLFYILSNQRLQEQGWRSGDNTRLPPVLIRPDLDFLTRRHIWTDFVGSVLCSERFFAGYSGFRLLPKINIWFDLIWFAVIQFDL